MKIRAIIIGLGMLLISCTKNIDCKSARIGLFETSTQNVGIVEVKRSDSLHIETIPLIDKQTISKVIWIDDCNFRLEYYKGDIPPGPDGNKPIICEIIEVGKDYHVVRARIKGRTTKRDYKMINKIK